MCCIPGRAAMGTESALVAHRQQPCQRVIPRVSRCPTAVDAIDYEISDLAVLREQPEVF